MSSAIISLLFGVIGFFVNIPMILPVIGLSVGVNALLKEKKEETKSKAVMIIAWIALALNIFVALMFIIHAVTKK